MTNNQDQPMYSQFDPETVKKLKKEILDDLEARREWQQKYYQNNNMGYGMNQQTPNQPQYQQQTPYQYDPKAMKQMKKEIMKDMEARQELQEEFYPEDYRMGYGRGMGMGRGMGRGPGYGMMRRPGYGMGLGRYMGWRPPYPPSMYRGDNYDYDMDWMFDREEYDYQRNRAMLRKQLQNELQAINKINRQIGQVSDPQVRQMVYELLQESRQQGISVQELLDSLNMNNYGSQMGFGSSLMDTIAGPFRNIDRRSFSYGVGAALLGLTVLPTLGKSLRPLASKTMEEFMGVFDNAQGMFSQAREELEDIVAEANFNKMKNSMGNDAGKAGQTPPTEGK